VLVCLSGVMMGVGGGVGWRVTLPPLFWGPHFGAGSGLPARSLLERAMLHDRWAGATSPPILPPLEKGMMWSP
jgi:hypothetical protein